MNSVKYDPNNLSTWTAKQLKDRAKACYCAVYQIDCFSSHDLLELEAVQAELEKRGYEFQESKTLDIVKA